MMQLLHRLRRLRWILLAQAKAKAAGVSLVLDVHPTARIGRDVVLVLRRGGATRLSVGAHSRIDSGVMFHLAGGTVVLGPRTELRRGTVIHVTGGHLEMQEGNILSWGCTVHCGDRVVLAALAGASEYVTITDSRHFHTDEETHFYHNTETAPVAIGRNTWLAAKATVLMGTEIGDNSVVGCHSVVSGRVPAATLVAGTPARPIRSTLMSDSDAAGHDRAHARPA